LLHKREMGVLRRISTQRKRIAARPGKPFVKLNGL
jgi:hypothetical protein